MTRAAWAGAFFVVTASAIATAPALAAAQPSDELEARIWTTGGDSPVFRRGDRASVYYRTTADAYVAVFHVDTDGSVRLLHPRVPDEDHYARRGRTYRVRFARSTAWYVDDQPGVGYFFVVASYRPMDFSAFRYSRLGGGWDLADVGRRVYQDPYLAMDDFVAALVPDWRTGAYALDFAEYHVDRRFEYPRFLCYDCHAFRPYRSWDPYRYQCHSFRLIVHTDPYFYPVTRYRGTRVVYPRPPARNQPRFAFKERARGEPAAPIFQRSSDTDLPGVAGAERRRSTGQSDRTRGGSAVPRAPTPGGGDAISPDARRRSAEDRRSPPDEGRGFRDASPSSDGRGGGVRPGAPDRREPAPRGERPSDRAVSPGAVPGRRPVERNGNGGADAPRTPSDRAGGGRVDRPSSSASDRDPPRPVLERRAPERDPRSPSREPDPPSRPPDGRSSPSGARPSTPPSARPREPEPEGRTVEPRASEPRRPQDSPGAGRSAPEPRERSPDRGGPSSRSPSSGDRDRAPSAGPRSGTSASPAPRGGGSRSDPSPGRRGRGRPPR